MRQIGITTASIGSLLWAIAVKKFLNIDETGTSVITPLYFTTVIIGSLLVGIGLITSLGEFESVAVKRNQSQPTWWDDFAMSSKAVTVSKVSVEQNLTYLYEKIYPTAPPVAMVSGPGPTPQQSIIGEIQDN